jgi:predicted nucleotide-binding protein
MSDRMEYRYDVFISYSHQDKAWVNEQLLSRLEGAGLRVCIDERDFAIGVPSLINMEQAVDNSRHTLIVLTPDWVASEWTEFESLLAGTSDPAGRRRKIIPLMLKQCEPPSRIAMLTWADFRDPQQYETQFNRLINQLRTMSAASAPTKPGAPPTSSEQSNRDIKMVSNTSQSEPMDPDKS